MASSMLKKFEKYRDVVHGMMAIAAILDPRYKMTLVQFYFPIIYGDDSSYEVDRIRKLCCYLVSEY